MSNACTPILVLDTRFLTHSVSLMTITLMQLIAFCDPSKSTITFHLGSFGEKDEGDTETRERERERGREGNGYYTKQF